jgi:hypothetical protein
MEKSMFKIILATLLLTLTFTVQAKPIGIAHIDAETAFILTDEDCPPGGPIVSFTKRFVLQKEKGVNHTGCYALLMVHPNLPAIVTLYINEEKSLIFLPLTSFEIIKSVES